MEETERDNLREIQRLNQRGGRILSIVDLIRDNTITPEMAALCWGAVAGRVSFITGAVPGGAGKTTLMAGILGFLPPGERIVTVSDRQVIDRALRGELEDGSTVLAHEIGSGHWFGYIWGHDAADFFSLGARGLRCVSCLHADDPGQAREILQGQGVNGDDAERLRMQLFMHVSRGLTGRRRRVSRLDLHIGGCLRQAYRWNAEVDGFDRLIDRPDLCAALGELSGQEPDTVEEVWNRRRSLLEELADEGTVLMEEVRDRVLQDYRR